jgi:hypothetical protein
MSIQLRPFGERDLEFLDRLVTDPTCSEPFQWFGFDSPQTLRRRWEVDPRNNALRLYQRLSFKEVGGTGGSLTMVLHLGQ